MSEKLFFITIPMLPSESLKMIPYRKEDRGELYTDPSRFPGIVMLDNCIVGDGEIKIITVRTDDDNGRTEQNYRIFKEELSALSKKLSRKLEISGEIVVPHSENREKQLKLFREICSYYGEGDEVYMDVTYGTKVTSVCLFSSLAYCEKIAHCNVKGVYYGKYAHGDSAKGELYNVRCLYEIAMLANAADHIEREEFDGLVDELWGNYGTGS